MSMYVYVCCVYVHICMNPCVLKKTIFNYNYWSTGTKGIKYLSVGGKDNNIKNSITVTINGCQQN